MIVSNNQVKGFSRERLERIAPVMNRFLDRGDCAGISTRVYGQGEIVHQAVMGDRYTESQLPMTPDTIFQIMSMSKPVTAVAAMLLYEQGYFSLNTPVAEFLPGFADVKVLQDGVKTDLKRPVTMRHLFTHTSGLQYGGDKENPVDAEYHRLLEASGKDLNQFTNKDLTDLLVKAPLAFQPGTKWHYGFSIDVIGRIIEVISAKTLDTFFQEQIFEPLGMKDTGFFVQEKDHSRLAAVYTHEEGKLKLMIPPDKAHCLTKPEWLSGGGGLVSTLDDYGNFCQMLAHGGLFHGEQLLSPATVRMFSENQAPEQALPYGFAQGEDLFHLGYGYSLGTRVLMDPAKTGQAGFTGEFGWDGAFNTFFWIDPANELYGLVMIQHSPNNMFPFYRTFKQMVYQALIEL